MRDAAPGFELNHFEARGALVVHSRLFIERVQKLKAAATEQ